MKVQMIPLIMAAACLWQASMPASAREERPARELEALVRQLGARKHQTREAAARQLIKLGREALPALERAARSKDPEISARARKLVALIRTKYFLAVKDPAGIFPADTAFYLTVPNVKASLKKLAGSPMSRLVRQKGGVYLTDDISEWFREMNEEEGSKILNPILSVTAGRFTFGMCQLGNNLNDLALISLNEIGPSAAVDKLFKTELERTFDAEPVKAGKLPGWNLNDTLALSRSGNHVLWALGDNVERTFERTVGLFVEPPKKNLKSQPSYQALEKWAGKADAFGRWQFSPGFAMESWEDDETKLILEALGVQPGMELQGAANCLKTGEETRLRLHVPKDKKLGGLLNAFRPAPITRETWQKLPASVQAFATVNLKNYPAKLDAWLEFHKAIDEDVHEELEEELEAVETEYGFDVKQEILSRIDGEVTAAFTLRPLPGNIDPDDVEFPAAPESVFFCKVKAPAAVEVTFRHLFAALAAEKGVKLTKRRLKAGDMYAFAEEVVDDGLYRAAFLVSDGWLYFGNTPESITNLILGKKPKGVKLLVDSPRCQAVLAKVPKNAGLAVYTDFAPHAKLWVASFAEFLEEAYLPPFTCEPAVIKKHFGPSVYWVASAGQSLTAGYRGSVGMLSPFLLILTAVLPPADEDDDDEDEGLTEEEKAERERMKAERWAAKKAAKEAARAAKMEFKKALEEKRRLELEKMEKKQNW